MQIYAPAENDHFGEGMRAPEGVFLQIDWLNWYIQRPDTVEIGNPGMERIAWLTPSRPIVETNTYNTCGLESKPVMGTRWEFGYVHEHDGLMLSILNLQSQSQRLAFGAGDVVFDDRPVGPNSQPRLNGYVAEYDGTAFLDVTLLPLPTRFNEITVKNHTRVTGVEADYFYRSHPGPHGGICELLLGARYLNFNDRFTVDARGEEFLMTLDSDTTFGPNAAIADAQWWSNAQNNLIGPQIGFRLFNQTERWTWESEFRFLAALNVQNLRQAGEIGSFLTRQNFSPPVDEGSPGVVLFQPQGLLNETFNHCTTKYEWSPALELRLGLRYQVTHAFGIRAEWNALWLNGIARAASLNDYTLYETQLMGIDLTNHRQDVFIQGLSLGFDINR